MRHIILFFLGVCLASRLMVGCGPRESPWEPVPPNHPLTLTAIPPQRTPTPNAIGSVTPTEIKNTSARLDEPFTLKISQWATLPDAYDTRVYFMNLNEDTRCALDISCYQAGSVRVAVTVESGAKLAQFDLSSWPTAYRRVGAFNGYLVQFVDIAPARTTVNLPIPQGDYQLTLRVSKGSLNVAQARINEPFTLRIGQSVPLAETDVQVTLESIKQDSRCPARVLCAWSGAVDVVIALQRGDKTEHLTLSMYRDGTFQRSSVFKTLGVYLNAVTPYPQNESGSKEIAPSEYEVTLVVIPIAL